MQKDEGNFTSVDIKDFSCFSAQIDPSYFEIIRVLGQGSFGKVYLVRKDAGAENGTLFAMKVLRKASLKLHDRIRTKMERDILANIEHPFIVRLQYGKHQRLNMLDIELAKISSRSIQKLHFIVKTKLEAFQTKGKLYLILEYLPGGDLFTRLSKEVILPEADVRFYLTEIILALNHLHQLGIIYRDLKPENILLDNEGHVKLTDFGLSKEAIHQGDGSQTFSFCGTIEYMAPEVITRRGHDSAADWWSLGVLMFEMLCGTLPFQGETRRHTMNQILTAKLQMPQFLGPDAQTLLRALFKRNPTNRLGYGPTGLDDLKCQTFFKEVLWGKLLDRSFPAPFHPMTLLSNDSGTDSLLSPVSDSPGQPPSASALDIFQGFNYTAPPKVLEHPKPLESITNIPHSISSENLTDKETGKSKANQCSRSFIDLEVGGNVNQFSSRAPYTAPHSTGSDLITLEREGNCLTETHRETSTITTILDTFSKEYELREVIGQGRHVTTWRCIHKRTFNVFAVRVIEKRLKDPQVEIDILTTIRQMKNVTKLVNVYDSPFCTYLVTVYASAGSLRDKVLLHHGLSEYETSRIIEVIAKIVHRDLRPNHIYYTSVNQDASSLQIGEFGAAKRLRVETNFTEHGTEINARPVDNGRIDVEFDVYTAPEVRHGELCGTSCDLWSLGMILCFVLTGEPPSSDEITAKVTDCEAVSSTGKQLIANLLTDDPQARMTAEAVVSHGWIRERGRHSRLPVGWPKENSNRKPTPIDKFQCSLTTLEPVHASRLAARRQENKTSDLKKKSSAVILHQPSCVKLETMRQSPIHWISPVMLKPAGKEAYLPNSNTSNTILVTSNAANSNQTKLIQSAGPQQKSSHVYRSPSGGVANNSFFTSTTFTLISPPATMSRALLHDLNNQTSNLCVSPKEQKTMRSDSCHRVGV